MKVLTIVGARPQFIKVAPVSRELRKKHQEILVHTGQHYDKNMSDIFFEELEIPNPDYNLAIGSGGHGKQTGEMLVRIEEVILSEKPDWVLVYGDTNSTLAGALAASKLHIPVAHVEAGLRSYNRKMPEEINRVLTDHISSILFCPTKNAVQNLIKEGFSNICNNGELLSKETSFEQSNPFVVNVGDVMYDSTIYNSKIAQQNSKIIQKLSLNSYILATIHRAENTDSPKRLKSIIEALIEISKDKQIIFPIHPRTSRKIKELGIEFITKRITLIEPVSYLDMLVLEQKALTVITDSGGVQKEAFFFKVPCITLRDETEWIETVEAGWNTLVQAKPDEIVKALARPIPGNSSSFHYGAGRAAELIISILERSNR